MADTTVETVNRVLAVLAAARQREAARELLAPTKERWDPDPAGFIPPLMEK